jgi:type VI secretion system Hcp family effector
MMLITPPEPTPWLVEKSNILDYGQRRGGSWNPKLIHPDPSLVDLCCLAAAFHLPLKNQQESSMQRVSILMTALLMMFAVPVHAALNGYAQIFIDGQPLDGDTTMASIGGVDVSTGYIEIYQLDQTLMAKAKSAPISIMKRVDQTTPKLAQVIAEGKTISGQILIFDNDPDTGETRHRFSIYLDNAEVVESTILIPDAFDASQRNKPVVEQVQINPGSYTLEDEINASTYTVGF